MGNIRQWIYAGKEGWVYSTQTQLRTVYGMGRDDSFTRASCAGTQEFDSQSIQTKENDL